MRRWRDEDGVYPWCLIESKHWSEDEKKGESEASDLGETNGGGLFTETLTAEVKTVFANNASLVRTQATGSIKENQAEF